MSEQADRCERGHVTGLGQHYCGTCGTPLVSTARPVWSTVGEALRVVAYGPHLRRTVTTALVVGTVLFAINQLNVVLAGNATGVVWLKSGLTYCVPFVVANIGILIATHRRR